MSTAVVVFPLRLAVSVVEVEEETAAVVTVKVALDWPDNIVTEFGNEAFVLLLASPTVSPFGPATPLIMIVPVDLPAPTTTDGFKLTDARAGGLIERVACTDVPFNVAVIVEFFETGTPTVAIETVAEV